MNTTEPPITQWSFHALKDFEHCPYRLYLKRVERSPLPEDPDDSPKNKGIVMHTAAEQFIRGELDTMQKCIKPFAPTLEILREEFVEQRVEVEPEWGFDETWEPTGYWADNLWTRIKPDVVYHLDEATARIYDWKSGNGFFSKLTHTEQGQLYAVGVIMKYPDIETVETEFHYAKASSKPSKRKYTRDAVIHFASRFTKRALKLTTATHFPAKPNKSTCRFCPFGRENGTGYCQFEGD